MEEQEEIQSGGEEEPSDTLEHSERAADSAHDVETAESRVPRADETADDTAATDDTGDPG